MRMLYFSWVRDVVGTGEEQVSPPQAVTTVKELTEWLAATSERHAAALTDHDRLRVAIDGVFAPFAAAIAGAREVAIFPPVTGG